jgi:hypothetical protein
LPLDDPDCIGRSRGMRNNSVFTSVIRMIILSPLIVLFYMLALTNSAFAWVIAPVFFFGSASMEDKDHYSCLAEDLPLGQGNLQQVPEDEDDQVCDS